jgi:ribosome-dependent ATPase
MTASHGIRVEQVTHCYGDAMALSSISLEIPAGRLIGFIGPDGVGKSSLLGLVAGAKRLQSGRIEVLGGDIADAAHRRRVCSRIAFMPEGLGRNLYPTLTVRENLEFFAQLFGTPVGRLVTSAC